MTARALADDAAVMNEHDEATEGDPQRICCFDQLRHILALILVADQGAVEGIDDDDGGAITAELILVIGVQVLVVGDEIE